MESMILLIFSAFLLFCIFSGASVLIALAAGLLLFLGYGKYRGFSAHSLWRMSLSGVQAAHTILITFLLIGMLTALWRACGTIPFIISVSAGYIHSGSLLASIFLLNSLVSLLTGTSFGTAATVGIISIAIAQSAGTDIYMAGGAVLSGIYVGDRSSPVSTSALLVSTLTRTDLYENIKSMARTAAIPFLSALALYAVIGALSPEKAPELHSAALFDAYFSMHPLCLLPAGAILCLSLFRVPVKTTMLASIVLAFFVSLRVQGMSASETLHAMVFGFVPAEPSIAPLISGGGILSMADVACIVCLSSCYAGIFQETGLLDRLKQRIRSFRKRAGRYPAMLATSVLAGMVACNQTLTIMLTHQLCRDGDPDTSYALDLEDSAVVIPPLIPWSIAGAVPLAAIGAPAVSLLFAFFLYLLPLWRLGKNIGTKH